MYLRPLEYYRKSDARARPVRKSRERFAALLERI
jgi:hypothetical protein